MNLSIRNAGPRLKWLSAALTLLFLFYGIFFHLSQQELLKSITAAKLADVEKYSEAKAKEALENSNGRVSALTGTIARLVAGQLENMRSFNLLKEGLITTLEPFLDDIEVVAIEVTDSTDRPYAAMWRSRGKVEFRVGYSMPPAFRALYRSVAKKPALASGEVQGHVTVFVDDAAISRRATVLREDLKRSTDAEIGALRNHFTRTLVPQILVLVAGISFVLFSSMLISRSYHVIHTNRLELENLNAQLEQMVFERTKRLELAVSENQRANGELLVVQSELLETIEELRQKDEALRQLAFLDPLTGLPNRALLLDRVEQSLSTATRESERRGLLFIDLDRFKAVNDTVGHAAGDAILKELAQRFRGRLREADTVARIGGDEFVVLLNHATSSDSYAIVARALVDIVDRPIRFEGKDLKVGVSIGIACFPEDGGNASTLLKHADMAMYETKTTRGGGFCFFQEAMTTASVKRSQLERELRQAIGNGELELWYQPKVCLATSEIQGLEALVRWRHPERGIVSPLEFIPLAEETGLIIPLGDLVFEQACRQAAAWRHVLGRGVRIAVNLSARQMQQVNLVERFSALFEEYGVPASDIDVELTESVIMANPNESASVLASLRHLGMGVAMDDFGTGYSSLSYLSRLPIDVLKIDRSFVSKIGLDDNDTEIVKMIIGLAQTLRLQVVAEGVETPDQAAFLCANGCDFAQGFLYAKPKPAVEIEELLRNGGAVVAVQQQSVPAKLPHPCFA